MIGRVVNRVMAKGVRTVTWKNMDNYYQYPFTNKMEFIDHTKRHPVFRAIDVEGNVLNKKYETVGKETLKKILDIMLMHREMDKVYLGLHRQGRITFYMPHLYEEAIGLTVCAAVKNEDYMQLQYREQGVLLWRGVDPLSILHSVKGDHKDLNLGRGLVFHYADPPRNIMPSSAPIGSKIGHAAGAGYIFRVQGADRICVNFMGDGATSEGDFHAGLNFASTLGAQTLFVVRNNLYGISTPIEDQFAGDGVAPRGIGYGMPAIKVDGCDPLALYTVVQEARKVIMERKGPVLIEAMAYRGGDHSTSDSAALYRTPKVVEKLQPYIDSIGDPIVRLSKYMDKKGWLPNSQEYCKSVSEKWRAECVTFGQEVEGTKFPDWKLMFTDVYKDMPWNIQEQFDQMKDHVVQHPEAYPLSDFQS